SVARDISKALNGRAVYWTCVGTPGVSASQIVKDIHEIELQDPNPKAARQLERIVKEFQTRRRRWIERRRQERMRRRFDTGGVEKPSVDEELKLQTSEERPKNYFVEWWLQIRENENRFKTPREIRETTRKVAIEWWDQVRNAFQKRQERVKEDISVIKEIVLEPLPKLDDADDDYYYDYYRENALEEETSDTNGRKGVPLIRKGSVFRRSSVNPEAAAEYDIAIVLTGLNDVKEAFMPHMMSRKATGDSSNGQGEERKLQTELYRVLEALQEKMGKMDLERNRIDHRGTPEKSRVKRPLVVVPELPVAPLQLFQLVPLCWFLVPIFRAMENNKRFLASCFPEYVVFVEQPEVNWWSDTETGIGPVRDNIQQEQLLLRVTDIRRAAREQIQDVMKQYYVEDKDDESSSFVEEEVTTNDCAIENDSKVRMMDDHDHLHYDVDRNIDEDPQRLGRNLVSADQIHPNDEGYELWGRHIATAISDLSSVRNDTVDTMEQQLGVHRQPNQDRILVLTWDSDFWMGLFDGHGSYGHCISHYCSLEFAKRISELWKEGSEMGNFQEDIPQSNVKESLEHAFLTINENMPRLFGSGTTAISIWKLRNKLYISNVGDSVAFVASYDKTTGKNVNIIYQTKPHKPDNAQELARIQAAGGQVEMPPFEGASARLLIPMPDGIS
ncbi:MAG: hypothetical protein SGILL_010628, partial [Bacillariaceae sp.]